MQPRRESTLFRDDPLNVTRGSLIHAPSSSQRHVDTRQLVRDYSPRLRIETERERAIIDVLFSN